MKILVLSCLIFLSLVVSGSGAVLTFDDITTGGGATVSSYGGLTWANISIIDKNTSIFGITNHGYLNGTVSGDYVALNDYGWSATVTIDSGLFDFNGTYLTAAFNHGLNIAVVGALNGEEIYNQTVTVDIYAPTWFDFNFFGIDKLVFSSSGGTSSIENHPGSQQFAMDNFTFNEAAPVPIPPAMLLFGTGLVGLAAFRRKLNKS